MTKIEDLGMPRRAYSYVRISSREQASGDGLRRQGEYAPLRCEREGWSLDTQFRLEDVGKSSFRGTNASVGTLALFLSAIESGRVSPGSVLIIESLDRLSRDSIDEAYDLFRSIIRKGIWIATRTPERIYSRETSKNMLDLLEPLFIFARAHEESQTKSFRSHENWAQKQKIARETRERITRSCPGWLEVKENGEYALIPDRVDTVRMVFTMARNGLGAKRICQKLNRSGRVKWTKGATWTPGNIDNILRSVGTWGAYQPMTFVETARVKTKGRTMRKRPNGDVIRDYYPPIIDESLFLEVQRIQRDRRRRKGRPGVCETNLFTSMIWIANTGEKGYVTGKIQGKNRPRMYRYVESVTPGTPLCIPYESIEDAILRMVEDMTIEEIAPNHSPDAREEEIGRLTRDMVALKDRQEEMERQMADPSCEPAGISALVSIVSRIATNRAECEKKLLALKEEVRTGRAEELAEAKGLIEVLRDAECTTDEELADLRRQVKARLTGIIREIWLFVEPIRRGSRLVHIQIDLCSGCRRYVQLLQSKTVLEYRGMDLSEIDLRTLKGVRSGADT